MNSPDSVSSFSKHSSISKPLLSKEEQEFIDSLDEKEKKSYLIAQSHLGSSFHLEKSNAFLRWVRNRVK
jgi:hypothetical protein